MAMKVPKRLLLARPKSLTILPSCPMDRVARMTEVPIKRKAKTKIV
jgi:hypothetical protein